MCVDVCFTLCMCVRMSVLMYVCMYDVYAYRCVCVCFFKNTFVAYYVRTYMHTCTFEGVNAYVRTCTWHLSGSLYTVVLSKGTQAHTYTIHVHSLG